ncbi:MAG: transporter substrate-binding domain-containing protein [Pseudomonadota bacterium]
MFRPCWRVHLLVALLFQPLTASADTVVRYPRPDTAPDSRSRFNHRLLELVLQRAYITYRVELTTVRMQQSRAIVRLKSGDSVDVLSTMTSSDREREMLPIRIPIDKGLIGWRLLMINKSQAERFKAVTSVDDLRKLMAGQGADWPDTRIMRDNGLTVYGTTNYESLFNMLENGRIDYFPRSVTEIWAELDLYPRKLMVEPSIVLHYPTAIYFFVRKGNTRLATDISEGLEKMIADGSYEKLFQEYFGDMLRRARFKDRRVFELNNPVMPKEMPVGRKNLWFRK